MTIETGRPEAASVSAVPTASKYDLAQAPPAPSVATAVVLLANDRDSCGLIVPPHNKGNSHVVWKKKPRNR